MKFFKYLFNPCKSSCKWFTTAAYNYSMLNPKKISAWQSIMTIRRDIYCQTFSSSWWELNSGWEWLACCLASLSLSVTASFTAVQRSDRAMSPSAPQSFPPPHSYKLPSDAVGCACPKHKWEASFEGTLELRYKQGVALKNKISWEKIYYLNAMIARFCKTYFSYKWLQSWYLPST